MIVSSFLRAQVKHRIFQKHCITPSIAASVVVVPVHQFWINTSKRNSSLATGYNRRWISAATSSALAGSKSDDDSSSPAREVAAILEACPGCGALAQVVEPGQAGYFSTKRRAVQSFVKQWSDGSFESNTKTSQLQQSASILEQAVSPINPDHKDSSIELPLCDRCHDLVHHHTGLPIIHPSIHSISDTIADSPYKHNHIYHVIDAADFPLSLIHNVHSALGAAFQRGRNRRARHAGFRHGRKTELSFIITRSDLLAPKKDQVDKLMQYFTSVLRDALGRAGQDVRLGNVHCVSAKRGWWTREIKAAIWNRGGAGWMVGKVNVGKSNLFEVVFPKGNADDINLDTLRNKARVAGIVPVEQDPLLQEDKLLLQAESSDLLPPARPESQFPVMPTISSLPGTTASPIRIPYGHGRGELIDLPGLARSDLDTFVRPEFREDLVMKSRITPIQQVIKPGRSLVLGGLIRITPVDSDIIVLAYPFMNIKPHLTSTEKAIALETQGKPEESGIPYIVEDGVGQAMASAGVFELKWDVTRQRAGPLTSKSAAGFKPHELPFVVLAADILVESVGWIEVVAQVRKSKGIDEPAQIPKVEVFSPHGKFVGVRQPMNAWMMGGLSTRPSVKYRKKRPRKSMAGHQRQPLSQ